jgi:hypothetical protein
MTVEDAQQQQLRNIEQATGRSIEEWIEIIRAAGHTRHGEIVSWLKAEHGLSHGTAHRLALTAIAASSGPPPANVEDALYDGPRAALRPIHRAIMDAVNVLGGDVETSPKKGYLSLRRRRQFAMVQPAARHVDVGLILPGEAPSSRLEAAKTFNALFTHRVRVHSVAEVDDQLVGWLRLAYLAAA